MPLDLELKQPQNMTDPPPYFTVGMRGFSLYAKHADAVPGKNVQFHLVSHNVNDVWQTPNPFFCVLWSEKSFFWQPFQWSCGYRGDVWWCLLKPGDHKMPPRSAILSLWSLGILLLLSPFSSVSWGAGCSWVLYPWGFKQIHVFWTSL